MSRAAAPGPRGHWLLGSLAPLRDDPLGFFLRSAEESGDVVRFRAFHRTGFIFRHPDHIQHVLVDNHRNYNKQSRGFKAISQFLGNGLLTSEGSFWLRQRRLMQPAFHRERIARLSRVMSEEALACAGRWEDKARSGEEFNAASEMMRLTLRVVSRSMFGAEISGGEETVERSMAVILKYGMRRITNPLLDFLPAPSTWKFRRAVGAMDSLVHAIIAARRARPAGAEGDLLSMLMEAKDEDTGESMDDRQLRDEAMTMFTAGHETTANALAWTFYLLAQNPAAETRLRKELAAVLGGRTPGVEDLPRLPYLSCVIRESLRLYPPAWVISRMSEGPDEMGGFEVPAGCLVIVSPHLTHRHPGFWPEPERFKPERFLEPGTAELPRFAYFPFGGGPRQCIGNGFALMEAQIVLATLLQRFRLELAPGHLVEPEPLITLRPKGGLWARARKC
ncbi:MAG TPA: cytochrome P450 [Elusimicrobiota bacterium]|nr:cytochrome P450 [Elusimicrobiota bacterium]